MRTIAIGNNEVDEFLAYVGRDSKWGKRLSSATSFYAPESDSHPSMQPTTRFPALIPQSAWLTPGFISPGIPAYAKPLPTPLHTGLRVRFRWHVGIKEVYYEGTITDHYIDADDCSGSYGEHKYAIKPDASSGLTGCSCPVKYCTLLSSFKPTGEHIQVDAWGKSYVLIDNGPFPSGIKYLS